MIGSRRPAPGRKCPIRWLADPQHTRLELENQWVRVFEEYLGPHETMPMHQHPAPGAVIVFLTARNNKLAYLDGIGENVSKSGWRCDVGGAHHPQIGESHRRPFSAIQIEPRPTANPKHFPEESMDAVKVDPAHYRVVAENQWIRAIA